MESKHSSAPATVTVHAYLGGRACNRACIPRRSTPTPTARLTLVAHLVAVVGRAEDRDQLAVGFDLVAGVLDLVRVRVRVRVWGEG